MTTSRLAPLVFLLSVFGAWNSASAKLFSNSYLSFELPPEWMCRQEGTEWVCVSKFAQQAKEAIIVLTAKEVGPSDNLAAYMAFLKQPKLMPVKSGAPQPSKVLDIKQRKISDHPWVDALHMGSEVPAYYTRYLATTKDRIAILVTFSAYKASYTKYSNDFIRAIDSLRVTANRNLLANQPTISPRNQQERIGQPIPVAPVGPPEGSLPSEDSTGGSQLVRKALGVALILVALGIYLLMRKKKRPRKPSR